MKSKISIVLSIIVLVSMTASTQDFSSKSHIFKPSDLVQKPSGLLSSFIDPARFDMNQSYSVSYLSSGKQSSNIGLYLNTLTYQIADPLLMQLRIGYMHQPFGQSNRPLVNSKEGGLFVQGAHLLYKPTENMMISFEYANYPSPMLSPYYWNRW